MSLSHDECVSENHTNKKGVEFGYNYNLLNFSIARAALFPQFGKEI